MGEWAVLPAASHQKCLANAPAPATVRRDMMRTQQQIPIRARVLRFIPLVAILPFCLLGVVMAEPSVAGLSSGLEPGLKGQVLIEELNCVACHSGDASLATRSKKSPRLAEVGSRINPQYMEAFIGEPHRIKPGTTMPDMLSTMAGDEKRRVANSLTHFLLSLKPGNFSIQAPDTVAVVRGMRLFHSRGCAACHSPRDASAKELLANTSVPLGALDKKYSFKSLSDFLRQPHASRPSGRMPDLRLQGQDIDSITHYLLQDTRVPGGLSYTLYRGQVWEGLDSAKVTAERAGQVKDFALESLGRVEHHSAIQYAGWINVASQGSYTFFLKMNGGSLSVDGKIIIDQAPRDGRGIKDLQGSVDLAPGWRSIQLAYFHTGREPQLACEMAGPQMQRQPIPASMLAVSDQPIPVAEPFQVDPALAAVGREQFSSLGCASCHDDLRIPSKSRLALAQLDASRGCLSKDAGAWPRFDLNAQQLEWIRKALPDAGHLQLSDKQRLDKTLATFNCTACHERSGLGGIAPERNALFTGTQPGLGDQGRLPPPLTDVGAKLQPQWISEVLFHGKRQRQYLEVSMPQFGEANVGNLVELFGKVDELETVAIPEVANVKESKDAGCEMVGTSGLSCIACHEFNGRKSGELAAPDIARVSERLKKNWFNLYLRQPSRFHPTVIMPGYWPGGQSVRPNILGGDAAQQIEAIWIYLEGGAQAKKPAGLSRQSNELSVSDVTEVCRGHCPVGYRGIGVGYPSRISLAFDSDEMALRQLWKGEFANVDIGSFHPRGTDTFAFPQGIPFHRLKTLEDNWPYKGKTNYLFPQDQGYQFRGYHLDATRRPTFLYHYGDIAVEDFFEDVRDDKGNAYFKRTLTFDCPTEPVPFYFRAAAGKKISRRTEREFTIDQLQLRITSEHNGLLREGNLGEVLIPLTPPRGHSTLTLDYQW